jgi:hypothetical protein
VRSGLLRGIKYLLALEDLPKAQAKAYMSSIGLSEASMRIWRFVAILTFVLWAALVAYFYASPWLLNGRRGSLGSALDVATACALMFGAAGLGVSLLARAIGGSNRLWPLWGCATGMVAWVAWLVVFADRDGPRSVLAFLAELGHSPLGALGSVPFVVAGLGLGFLLAQQRGSRADV